MVGSKEILWRRWKISGWYQYQGRTSPYVILEGLYKLLYIKVHLSTHKFLHIDGAMCGLYKIQTPKWVHTRQLPTGCHRVQKKNTPGRDGPIIKLYGSG